MPYDRYIYGQEAWDELVRDGLGIIVDPLVFRLGQFYLEGGTADDAEAANRWTAIENDIGALVAFFDLVVLHERFPAFNYEDTFDPGPNVGDPLGKLLNTHGDDVLVHVDVEHEMYRQAKAAAIGEIQRRMALGPVLSRATADEITRTITAVGYEWEPSLKDLEPGLEDPYEARVARFLLGQLVFAGYAQQTGAPHVLAPKRSLLLTAVGLQAERADVGSEAAIYDELRRRSRVAGAGWRVTELPWTPSFLPLLVQRAQKDRYRVGPDVLLERAKELRTTNAIERYRKLRDALLSADAERSGEARRELTAAADKVARSLNASRDEIESFQQVAVEAAHRGVAAAAGAAAGAALGGPPGAAAGAAGGFIADRLATVVHQKLWGWSLEGLTFRSARKLLTRSLGADFTLQTNLARELRTIWESPRASA